MKAPDLSSLALAPQHLDALRALLRRHVPHAEVRAFGSRVGGGAHEGSDLDLLLCDVNDPTRPLAGAADLREALQASALPMLVEVHDASQLPAQFLAEIRRRELVIQAQPQNAPIHRTPAERKGPAPCC